LLSSLPPGARGKGQMEFILILLLALVTDAVLGEPPNAAHPVAWMGKVISFLEKGAPEGPSWFRFIYGTGMGLITVALFSAPVFFLLVYLQDWNQWIYVLSGAALLKITFSGMGLRRAALKVKRLLQNDKLEEARFEMRALVSRDTNDLSKSLLVSATVESTAEGACDSLIAPLFYFLVLGVPGAVGYRVVNTLDAMIGYHGKYEYLGKFASRLDDVLNFIPARLTAVVLVMAAFLTRRNGKNAWGTALRDHTNTESPNAGWPMAAMAGALEVRLEKAGHYRLGSPDNDLTEAKIDDAVNLFQAGAFIWSVICLITGVIYFAVAA